MSDSGWEGEKVKQCLLIRNYHDIRRRTLAVKIATILVYVDSMQTETTALLFLLLDTAVPFTGVYGRDGITASSTHESLDLQSRLSSSAHAR